MAQHATWCPAYRGNISVRTIGGSGFNPRMSFARQECQCSANEFARALRRWNERQAGKEGRPQGEHVGGEE